MIEAAEKINNHLSAGGHIQVTTRLRSTIYSPKHAGMFFAKNGSLYVKRGKTSDQLSIKNCLLVKIGFSEK